MKVCISLLLFHFFSVFCLAQNVGIEGNVIDGDQEIPLIGATVNIGNIGTTTNVNGYFRLACSPGHYTLNVSYIGYDSQSIELEVTDDGMASVNIQLTESSTLLETATITGSKFEKSLARAPVSINVLKSRLVENTNTVNVISVLEKIPGVQIVDNQANIRGGSGFSYGAGSRVLLLVDDIPALQGDAGRPSWGDIPVENISQIEVIKGASSTLYGSAAMNGIINVRTGYATSEPVTKVNVGYTHFLDPKDARKKWWTKAPRRYNAGIVHKQKFKKLDVVASGFFEDLSSYQQSAYDQKFRLSTNLKYRVNDRIVIGLNSMYNRSEAGDSFLWLNGGAGAYSGLQGSFSERISTRYYFDPQISIVDKHNNRHKILSRLYYIDNNNNNAQSNSSFSKYLEYQYLSKVPAIGIELTAGASALLIDSDSELFGNVALSSNNVASFMQADKKIGEDLTLTVGLRYEYFFQRSPEVISGDTIPNGETNESKLIARAGLNYRLAEGTYIRASWGEGYRVPTLVERFIETQVSSFYIFPNVNLQSETGWSAELGIKQGIRIGTWEGFFDLAGFWSQYQNMTEFTFFENIDERLGFQSQNVGAIDIKGFEVNFLGRSKLFGHDLNVLCGYTFINPRYKDFNTSIREGITAPVGSTEKVNFLKYRSKHNFKIDLESEIEKFTFGVAFNYTSEVKTMDALLSNLAQIGLYRQANPGGYLKLDARVSYNFKYFKLSLLGDNVLNEEYTIRPGLMEAPRNISVRLDFKL